MDTINVTVTVKVFETKVNMTIPLDQACAVNDGIIARRVAASTAAPDDVRSECQAIAASCRTDALNAASAAVVAAGKSKREVRSAHLRYMQRALKAAGK